MILKEPFSEYIARGWFTSPSHYKNAKSPAEVNYKRLHPPKKTLEVFTFGHAVHTMMLEAHLFEKQFHIMDYKKFPVQEYNKDGSISMRSKRNQTYANAIYVEADVYGMEVLTGAQFEQAYNMCEAYIKFNPELSKTLLDPTDGMIEVSFYGKAIFSDNGVFEGFGDIPDLDYKPTKNEMLVKTRPDYLKPDTYYLDIKTCESAYPPFFAKDCLDLGYDIQAAFILDFCNFLLGATVENFFFLAMEKKEPYPSVLFLAPPAMLSTGRAKYQTRLEKLHKKSNEGYLIYAENPDQVYITIPFPKYAIVSPDDTINW